MRQTSILAYRSVRDSGLIGRIQKMAYHKLAVEGPCTARELESKCGIDGLWRRFSELESLGLVYEVETRPCHITGRRSTVWDCTSKLAPTERSQKPKRESRAELLKRIARLEIEVQNLKTPPRKVSYSPIKIPATHERSQGFFNIK